MDASPLDRATTALRALRDDGVSWAWIEMAAQHLQADELPPVDGRPIIVDLHALTTPSAWRQPMPGSPRA